MIRIALLAACLALLQTPADAGPFDSFIRYLSGLVREWIKKHFGYGCHGHGKIHNYYFGHKTPKQRMLYDDAVLYDSEPFTARTIELRYPERDNPPVGIIRYIEVLDREKGTGGCVSIKSGGIGKNYVVLQLLSQRNRQMFFDIHIYGN